jgi:choline dehydrogenase
MFRVRGVAGLRVIDASAFARIPGVFPAASTFIISQKASDEMLADLAAGKAIPTCSV